MAETPKKIEAENGNGIDALHHLTASLIGLIKSVFYVIILLFFLLLVVYISSLLLTNSDPNARQAISVPIQDLIFKLWSDLMPVLNALLKIISPLLIFFLAIVGLERLAGRSGVLDFTKLASDLPSVLALLIVATICILPLAGIEIPTVLNNVALVVVGFYFGKRETKGRRKYTRRNSNSVQANVHWRFVNGLSIAGGR